MTGLSICWGTAVQVPFVFRCVGAVVRMLPGVLQALALVSSGGSDKVGLTLGTAVSLVLLLQYIRRAIDVGESPVPSAKTYTFILAIFGSELWNMG